MSLPYRARRNLRRLFVTLLVLILIAACVLLCWLLWLHRYVVYTQDGARLDFDQPLEYPQGETAVPPDPLPSVNIQYDDGKKPEEEINTELVRFSGYYVTLETLRADFDAVLQQLEQLPHNSTVLLDVKSIRSYSYYSTDVGMIAPDFDTLLLDELIRNLQDEGHYIIARIPAFQEYEYILENERERVPYGLPRAGGNGSLWLDTTGPCYWMNPASDGTLAYLIQIVSELRNKGFDEVVFSDFRYPETDKIKFPEDKDAVLNQTATTLVKTCATERFAVSFTRTKADLTLPEGRTRLYLTGVAAADAAAAAQASGFEDPSVGVVFLTEQNDTRYDAFCALRPLSTLH
jgi:hypothetical protein